MRKKIFAFGCVCVVVGVVAFGGISKSSKAMNIVNDNSVVTVDENMSIQETEDILLEKGYSYRNMQYRYIIEIIEKLKSDNKSDYEILEILDETFENNNERICRSNPLDLIEEAYKMWGNLTEDEKKLIISYPKKALVGLSATNKATEYTKKEFGKNGLGDKSDAFRHTLWCALMSRDAGAKFAKDFSTAHESGKTEEFLQEVAADGHKEYEHREMDLHNNSIGVKLGDKFNERDEELIKKVKEKMTNDKNTGVYWLHE